MFLNDACSLSAVDIDLDKHIYNPGDVIHGEIKLTCKKKLYCQCLRVKLYGLARVFFTELQKTPGRFGQTKAFEQERVLVEQTKDLWCADSIKSNGQLVSHRELTLNEIVRLASPNTIRLRNCDAPASWNCVARSLDDVSTNTDLESAKDSRFTGLDAGVHEFKFQFQLPNDGLFTSFDARNSTGHVRYFIIVQALNDGHTVLRKKLLFPVVCPSDLSSDLQLAKSAIEPACIEATKLVNSSGEVYVKLELGKRGYVPGEPIVGQIHIDNRSSKSVKYAFLRIVQHTKCYSTRPELCMRESCFETPGMALPIHKVVPHSRFSYAISFYVPALLPSMCIPECIEASYLLQLDVGFKRGSSKYSFIHLKVPIIIGTHPTADARDSLISEASKKHLPQAPPAYFEVSKADSENASIQLDVPPPAYVASAGGFSEASEGPKNDNGFGINAQSYAPLIYHYSFGISNNGAMASRNGVETSNGRQDRCTVSPTEELNCM